MSKDNTQDELRERIGNLKPHTETQLPLKDILSYLEMNALIEVVNSEVRQVLDRLEKVIGQRKCIEAERKRYEIR